MDCPSSTQIITPKRTAIEEAQTVINRLQKQANALRGGRFEVVDKADSGIGPVSNPYNPLGRHRFVGQSEGL